jgi:hypothetical protein
VLNERRLGRRGHTRYPDYREPVWRTPELVFARAIRKKYSPCGKSRTPIAAVLPLGLHAGTA